MNYYGYNFTCESTLQHHGIKGQKWGIRRYQNEDGTWTAAGRERYGNERSFSGNARRALAKVYDINERFYSKRGNSAMAEANRKVKEQMLEKAKASDEKKANKLLRKDEQLEKEFNESMTSQQAEIRLARIIRRDIEAGQSSAERIFKNLTGANQELANATSAVVKRQMLEKQRKDMRSKMSTGQKVIDTLYGNSENHVKMSYLTGDYKKLRSAYESSKGDALTDAAKQKVKSDRRMAEYQRQQELAKILRENEKHNNAVN